MAAPPSRRTNPIKRRHIFRRMHAWVVRMGFRQELRYLPETKEPKR